MHLQCCAAVRKAPKIRLHQTQTAVITSTSTDKTVSAANGTSNSENKTSSEQSGEPAEGNSKILIAYFTWAENTHVEEPEKVDVDASTSASVLAPGNAAKLANWIQQEVGGDLFSIVVKEPYSSDYDQCLDRAADEKAANARPELVNHLDNMADYDIIFLGFPNWWYTVPMAIHSFIEEYDFSGKTVVPFVTHGTGGLASTIKDITAALPDSANILEPIGVYRPEVDASHDEVIEWLKGLELDL
ncbi:MAG: NAD(P)H-dependent oxidoreductase [Ruminiclostridium sp.]|nr:NAD(P)H-dependent oxidoreductase [Ruminiclostridium sp.]